MNNEIDYQNLYIEFKKMFPQYSDYFKKMERDNLVDETDGAHVTFSYCVVPLVYKFLDEGKDAELKKSFEFFERMASSKDHLVSEVIAFTILENVCAEKERYLMLKPYFGKNTLDLIPLIQQFCNI